MNNDHEPGVLLGPNEPEPLIIARQLLRRASAEADLSDQTALRILAGYPTRGRSRERLAQAFAKLGAPWAADRIMTAKVSDAAVETGKQDHTDAVMTAKGPGDDADDDDTND